MSENPVEIPVCPRPILASIRPPGSKSLTNRALVCAALGHGTSELTGALDSEDTRIMIDAWRKLGVSIEREDQGRRLTVVGSRGRLSGSSSVSGAQRLFMGNSGTSIRFMTAAVAALGGWYVLDGVERMRARPIGDLGLALRNLGASVECHEGRFPPVEVKSKGLSGGVSVVSAELSSQFLSGLLMAAPLAKHPIRLTVEGPLVSEPYVEMTCALMKSFGVEVHRERHSFQIEPQAYRALVYDIEPDASAASYFWAAAAVTQGDVTVTGLHANSLQGDVQFVRCLEQMGCQVQFLDDAVRVIGGPLRGIEVDMGDVSDTVQTLAAVALFAEGPTVVRGVAHNRVKETDRIEDLATELRRVGATVDTFEDGLAIQPGVLRPAEIETYNDHRMAMSLALIGLRQPGIRILNPGCTVKTYPDYFKDLFSIYPAGR